MAVNIIRAIAALFLVVPALPVSPAFALTQLELDWCANVANREGLSLQIEGCTAAINSGRLSVKDQVWVLHFRADAYTVSGKFDLAMADYDEAVRLNPDDARSFAVRAKAH